MSAPSPSPIRLLMTTDTVGGVWTYAIELIRPLCARGMEILLATMGRPLDADQRRTVEEIEHLTVAESSYRLEWMENPLEDVEASGQWLLELARTFEPDIVHLNSYAHGALDFGAPRLVVAHSDVLSWWRAVHGELPPASWDRYRRAVSAGLEGADQIVAPTASMLSSLHRNYAPRLGGIVIANGRDPRGWEPGSKGERIATAGRIWDGAKNVAALARVASRLDWPVQVAGDASHPDGGRARFEGVEFRGMLPSNEMRSFLGGSAIYALPARYEPFGLSVLEAALSGCALVLSDIPSLRENWNGRALFVPLDDDDRLIEALQSLARDRALREQLAAAARERALQLGSERMARSYLNLYTELMFATDGEGAGEERTVCAS